MGAHMLPLCTFARDKNNSACGTRYFEFKIVFASPLIYTAVYHGNIETLPLLYNYLALGVKIWIRKNALSLENKRAFKAKFYKQNCRSEIGMQLKFSHIENGHTQLPSPYNLVINPGSIHNVGALMKPTL